jgi:3-isopropylmalate/(R)-2-methylmalate dehydratase small subunit
VSDVIEGRVWVFGDDVNTDLIIISSLQYAPVHDMAAACFSAIRPGWSEEVRPGDVLVAGRNFGVGSGRAIGDVFRHLGVSCIVADSFNGLGMRNCVNVALPVLPCPGVAAAFADGDVAEVAWRTGTVRNRTRGADLRGQPIPVELQAIVDAGGVIPHLRAQGYLAAEPPAPGPAPP